MAMWTVTMDPMSNFVGILQLAPPINLLAWMGPSAFPNPWSAMVTVVVLMILTHQLTSVTIALMIISTCVRKMASTFVQM